MASDVIELLSSEDEEPAPTPAASASDSKNTKKRKAKSSGRGGRHRHLRKAGDAASSAAADEAEQTAAAALANLPAASLRQQLLDFGLRPGKGPKVAMALRLVRAKHAAAASEALYASATSRRFDGERAGRVNATLDACRLCNNPIAPPRKTFCSDECVHFHLLRTSGSHVRKALALRDNRKCVLCGTDCAAAYTTAKKAVAAAVAAATTDAERQHAAETALAQSVANGPFAPHAKLSEPKRGRRTGRRTRIKVKEGSFWQADHLVAVHEGGGCCGLANLRTLCSACHANVTREQAAKRAQGRRGGGGAAVSAEVANSSSNENAAPIVIEDDDEEEEDDDDESDDGEDDAEEETLRRLMQGSDDEDESEAELVE
jgi:5-methylcytosine-specific restriction protein A